MSRGFLGLIPVLVLLAGAVVNPAAAQSPAAAPPSAGAPAANGGELSDDQIREQLSKQSVDQWTEWKNNRSLDSKRACSDYNDGKGPSKPAQVYCSPDAVPAAEVQKYREQLRKEESTFVNEPAVKF